MQQFRSSKENDNPNLSLSAQMQHLSLRGVPSVNPQACMFDLDECYFAMLTRETVLKPYKQPPRTYLKYRRYLIDWTSEAGERMNLSKITIHTACVYLETLVSTLQMLPGREKLQLIATCCLYIAAKVEDAEENLPSLNRLGMQKFRCNKSEFKNFEMQVLVALKWKLSVLTPIHFLGIHLNRRVFFPHDHLRGKPIDDQLLTAYRSFVDFFVDFILQESTFGQYRPSILAASILSLSRKALDIRPIWRRELTILTNYEFEDFELCFDSIWSHFAHCFPSAVAFERGASSPSSVAAFPNH